MAKKHSYSGTKTKRTLSDEQLAKMKAGRERAAKQRERVEMLAELDEKLRQGRIASETNNAFKMPRHRRRRRK